MYVRALFLSPFSPSSFLLFWGVGGGKNWILFQCNRLHIHVYMRRHLVRTHAVILMTPLPLKASLAAGDLVGRITAQPTCGHTRGRGRLFAWLPDAVESLPVRTSSTDTAEHIQRKAHLPRHRWNSARNLNRASELQTLKNWTRLVQLCHNTARLCTHHGGTRKRKIDVPSGRRRDRRRDRRWRWRWRWRRWRRKVKKKKRWQMCVCASFFFTLTHARAFIFVFFLKVIYVPRCILVVVLFCFNTKLIAELF